MADVADLFWNFTDAALVLGGIEDLGLTTLANLDTVADATVTRRGDRWWMAIGGISPGERVVHLYAATLPDGSPPDSGHWQIATDPHDPRVAVRLAPAPTGHDWDATGYHCASYVAGQDSDGNRVERLYYASASSWESLAGPYRIGFLQWDGDYWRRQPGPVFAAAETWEHGTVLEPNVYYEQDAWTLYYTAGIGDDRAPVTGIARSRNGIGDWHRTGPLGAGQFDALLVAHSTGYQRITARHPLAAAPGPSDGLWYSPTTDLDQPFTAGTQIVATPDASWHNAGIWKPTAFVEGNDIIVLFNAAQQTDKPGPGTLGIGCIRLKPSQDRKP
jgi:predicted GH43/DUF377 family glycosyl hydrolase